MTSHYIAQPQSRARIRQLTEVIRRKFDCDNQLYFPVVEFLEVMPTLYASEGFDYEIVENHVLISSVQADMDILNCYMRVKESVYDGACKDKGRDRFSIAHEIGHFMLSNIAGVRLQRNMTNRTVNICEDPEWQAEAFAGELLIPMKLVQGMTSEMIAEKCKVSLAAARTQLRCCSKKIS
jgi:Zn-dependent peptidase ImmA (M78 family)